ncbi:hypothetical protein G647_02785 [Cladophialophora carrionii CBS 160.54]|uniref:Xylanolytic transcriptional activator regulatory domain-containing protein n=1 Tax=Cladophialophora carrionii CBS 160.54 TaxID=1279043 RepID=V9DI65_9EURO|nr:uncharacterized protein G647_02785 [Cladophialophora carrionii CBS 160.54]ETI26008.1 hypothetical protein G647_02785 [Cladophialophora carrionii CBS 160.54]
MQLDHEPFGSLNWPDSEDLLNSILSAEFTTLPALEVLPSQSIVCGTTDLESHPVASWLTFDSNQDHLHGGNHAVQSLSHIINSTSGDVTSTAQSLGLTSVFLDGCLHMFFTQFVPNFPVVHRPTFVFRDWTSPLLLNAIALGSLFMGKKDCVAKGEALWRLAHTAVATSWSSLIRHRGPYDICPGIQLVLTALLGQVYATLSRNIKLRKTAQVFHSLGFFWARETGMFDLQADKDSEAPALDRSATEDVVEEEWKVWAAKETQLRALLGHYVLDAQLSDYTSAPSQRHTSHCLPAPANDAIFGAQDAVTWRTEMLNQKNDPRPFFEMFCSLFSENVHVRHPATSLSSFTASVLLEGLKALSAERIASPPEVIGMPSEHDISRALRKLHTFVVQSKSLSSVEKDVALLRWHTICLHMVVDLNPLCRALFQKYNINQHVISARRVPPLDLSSWVSTSRARLGLLHAFSIYGILQNLPFVQTQRIDIPMAVFSAAMMYSAFLLGGVSTISLPETEGWESVIPNDLDTPPNSEEPELVHEVRQYLNGRLQKHGRCINLLYDINLFSRILKTLEELWGVSYEMHRGLEELSLRYT